MLRWMLSAALFAGIVITTTVHAEPPPVSLEPAVDVSARKTFLVDLDVRFVQTKGDVKLLPARFQTNLATTSPLLSAEELAHIERIGGTDPRVRTVAIPRLHLRTGTPGSFRRGREIPYSESDLDTESPEPRALVRETLFVGTSLEATIDGPSRDGSLQVNLIFEESNLLTPPSWTRGKPDVDSTRLSTNLTLESGQTAVAGGLQTERQSTTESRVPILGRLPVVGPKWFTRMRTKTESTTNMLLVTPVIIEVEP